MTRKGAIASEGWGGQIGDHAQTALAHVDRADDWANREADRELRNRVVDYNLRLAQIHATLAVAQQVNFLTAGR